MLFLLSLTLLINPNWDYSCVRELFVLKMLYVTETLGPLPPAEQPMAIPPILCKCPACSVIKGRWGTFKDHWKNIKTTKVTFRMKTNSQKNCFRNLLFHPMNLCTYGLFGFFPSRCQQAGPGETYALWSSWAQPVTRHKVAVLGLCISMPTCNPWCHGDCVVSCRVL